MKTFSFGSVGCAALAAGALMLVPAAGALAAESTCGRISVFDSAPRGQQLYPAVLIAIDGRLPGPSDSPSFRIAPGKHVLTVAENIDAHQFSSVQQYQRSNAGRDRYQKLELDVQPGVTYRLAAKFDPDQRNAIRDNAYWSPMVWSQISETCR